MTDESDISKLSCTPLCKKIFEKTYVKYVTVWLVRIWTYKNADEKEHSFSWRKTYKNGNSKSTFKRSNLSTDI